MKLIFLIIRIHLLTKTDMFWGKDRWRQLREGRQKWGAWISNKFFRLALTYDSWLNPHVLHRDGTGQHNDLLAGDVTWSAGNQPSGHGHKLPLTILGLTCWWNIIFLSFGTCIVYRVMRSICEPTGITWSVANKHLWQTSGRMWVGGGNTTLTTRQYSTTCLME